MQYPLLGELIYDTWPCGERPCVSLQRKSKTVQIRLRTKKLLRSFFPLGIMARNNRRWRLFTLRTALCCSLLQLDCVNLLLTRAVAEFSPSSIDTTVQVTSKIAPTFFDGIGKWNERLVHLINLSGLVQEEDFRLTGA
jgi:hypothetical protein